MLNRIVVAIDGSEGADRALDVAAELASRYGAFLTLVTVVPPTPTPYLAGLDAGGPGPAALTSTYDALLASRRTRVRGPRLPRVETVRREGVVVEELLDYLDRDRPDLLVVGSRGLSAGRRLFLGSVSGALVHHAPCPVLVVRHR